MLTGDRPPPTQLRIVIVEGKRKRIVGCPECGMELFARGYSGHYKTVHQGATTPIMRGARFKRRGDEAAKQRGRTSDRSSPVEHVEREEGGGVLDWLADLFGGSDDDEPDDADE